MNLRNLEWHENCIVKDVMIENLLIGKYYMLNCMPYKISTCFLKRLLLLCLVVFVLALHLGQAWGAPVTTNYSSSIPINNGDPARIAIDPATGLIFVAVPRLGKVLMFTQDGREVSSINTFERPLSVADDSSGKLYVGNLKDRSVTVMDSNGEYLFSLGNGNGEFGMPGDIAVAQNGSVYVTDSTRNKVNVYDSTTGIIQFSFGTAGNSAGQMLFPTGIACDNTNQEVYVVDQTNGRVEVFSFNGIYKRSFGSFGSGSGRLTRAQGIFLSVDNVYVVDAYQSSVEAFDKNGLFVSFIGSFGTDAGKLRVPADIAISGSKMFVTNTDNARIEVYDIVNPQGLTITPSSLFIETDTNVNPPAQSVDVAALVSGSTVTWTATASAPFGVTLSQTSGTVPSSVTVNVDVSGLSAGTYAGGVIFRSQDGTDYPLSVIVDVKQSLSQLLVSPGSIMMAYQDGILTSQTISIDSSGGNLAWTAATDVPWLTLSASSGSTPGSITVSLNQNVNTLSDGVYNAVVTISAPDALESPISVPVMLTVVRQKLTVSPANAIMVYQDGILTSQTISVTSNSNVQWTAATDAQWLTLSASSGSTPSDVTASLNANVNTLTDGTYNATVTISANDPNVVGSPAVIPVTLTVVRQRLVVSPDALDLFHQKDGDLATKSLLIQSSGGILAWTAETNVQWLTLSASSGSTSEAITVYLNQNADSLPEGVYNASVSIVSPNAANSPVTVSVTLKVVVAGTVIVNTNFDQSSFSINGADASYAGSGNTWRNDEIVPGVYSIQFNHLQGLRRPPVKTFEVKTGESVTIDAVYRPLPVANVIAAAKGPGDKNDSLVRIFDLSGNPVNQFLALSTNFGARIAMGDIEGDGSYEIIVAPGNGNKNKALFNVFRYDGSLITALQPLINTVYGADVAAGDIDGDGKSEIAMSILDVDKKTHSIIIYSADTNYALTERARFSFISSKEVNSVADIAFGDVDGDGWLELIVSHIIGGDYNANMVTVYAFDETLNATPLVSGSYPSGSTVSAMDLNGEGVDEIVIGYNNGVDSLAMFLNGDLTDYGTPPLTAFNKNNAAPNLSAMDTDGDAVPSLLAGMGDRRNNPAVMRIYNGYGMTKEIMAFEGSIYGVNAAFGVIK